MPEQAEQINVHQCAARGITYSNLGTSTVKGLCILSRWTVNVTSLPKRLRERVLCDLRGDAPSLRRRGYRGGRVAGRPLMRRNAEHLGETPDLDCVRRERDNGAAMDVDDARALNNHPPCFAAPNSAPLRQNMKMQRSEVRSASKIQTKAKIRTPLRSDENY